MGETTAAADLRHVLAPLQMGPLRLRNRVVVPAHTTNFGESHLPTDRHLAYHEARAAGGVGAIIFESIRVHRNSLGRPQGVDGSDPRCVEPFRRIAERVREHGARLLGQVIHLGRQIDGDFERTVSWGPSAVPWSALAPPPHEMDEPEMDEVLEAHVRTVGNLLAAGLDGIELQMGHGHLLQQFLSPLSNARTDHFGGALADRMRFPATVLAAVRAAVGPDTCLGIRVSADEFVSGGLDLAEATEIVARLVAATPVDFVNVSHSAYHGSVSLATQMADMAHDPARFRLLPAAVRERLRADGHPIPVVAVCRFTGLAEADRVIADGTADAVAMARAHIADPDLVAKTVAGRTDEIRPCIGCNQGCAGMLEKNIPIRCLVNPRSGRELVWLEPPPPPATRRRVLVVGGGPAGMEAAAVAAGRGHDVRLREAADVLGGRLRWTERIGGRQSFGDLLHFQRSALRRAGVEVITGSSVTEADVAADAPDVVVLATGAEPVRARWPGDGTVATLEDAIAAPDLVGDTVAVVDLTGDWPALSVVEHLADLGRRVVVLSPVAAFAWRTTIYSTLDTTDRLRRKGVRLALLRRVAAWDGAVLEVEDVSTGVVEPWTGIDTVVAADWPRAHDPLSRALGRSGLEVHRVGDCVAPRSAMEAIHQGHELARSL